MRASDAKLHEALTELGFPDLAKRAAGGEWNDYFGPHAMPQHHLVYTLQGRIVDFPSKAVAINDVIVRVKDGDFDGTPEESAEWAKSPEGQSIFTDLLGGQRP